MTEDTPDEHSPAPSTSATPSAGTATAMENLRRLALALTGGAVLVTASVVFVLAPEEGSVTPVSAPMLLAVVGLLGAAMTLIELVGYRATPVEPGADPQATREGSAQAFQSTTVLRFALAEGALIVAVALAFVLDGGVVLPVVLAGAGAVVLMLLHVYPRERTIARLEQSLERGGAPAYLREALQRPVQRA